MNEILLPAGSVFIIEDHDEAFRVWRQARVTRRLLVHVDAHTTCGESRKTIP